MTEEENLPEFRFLGFMLDARNRKLIQPDGEKVHLNSRAFDTLLELVKNHGRTVSKTDLMKSVWSSAVVEENNLNQAIFSLRRALGDSTQENRFIRTVSGRGYCFVAPVEEISAGAVARSNPLQSWFSRTGHLRSSHIYLAALCLLVVAGTTYITSPPDSTTPDAMAGSVLASEPEVFTTATVDSNDNTIAVLPFTAPSLNKDQELFAIGLHDEVISQLSKIRSLNVIARNSILSLVEQDFTMDEIADLLNVGSFVSGTIMFSGGQARIILDMHDAGTGITRWSGSYEVSKGDLAEMFSIQSEIAIGLARALEAEIQQREEERITRIPTNSVDAYRYYLSARIAHFKQDFANEWQWSKQALEIDPAFYDAHALFSSVNTVLVSNPLPGMNSHQHYLLGLEHAERLIELDSQNSKGYALKAIALSTNRDWEGVFRIVDGFMRRNAPLANLNYIAIVMLSTGDFDKAIEIYRANLRTEPLNLYGRGFLMVALELAGRREESRAEFMAGEELSDFWWGDIVNVFLALGRDEQIPDIDELVSLTEEHRHTLEKLNAGEDITQELYAYRKVEMKVSAEATHYAALAAHIGEHDLAIEFMRAALKDNWSAIFWSWLPVFDETRKSEGFKSILVDAGLVDLWDKRGWPEVCQPTTDSFSCNWKAY